MLPLAPRVVFAVTNGYLMWAIVLVAAALLLRQHRMRDALFLALSSGVTMLIVGALKSLFHIARPAGALVELSTYAFPSGHAAGSTFLAIILPVLFVADRRARRSATAALLLVAAFIGASRLYLGVHTPLEVLAGSLVGGALGLVALRLKRRID